MMNADCCHRHHLPDHVISKFIDVLGINMDNRAVKGVMQIIQYNLFVTHETLSLSLPSDSSPLCFVSLLLFGKMMLAAVPTKTLHITIRLYSK